MKNKIKIDSNKVILTIIISVIFFVTFFCLHQNAIYKSYHYVQKSIDEVLTSKNVIYTEGYTLQGNKFSLNQEGAFFKVASSKKAKSIRINLTDMKRKKVDVKIYYTANDSVFNEAKTLTTSINKSEGSITFNIPSDTQNDSFMIHIGDSFTLQNIEISSKHAVLEKTRVNNSNLYVFTIIDLLTSFGLSLLIVRKDWINKFCSKVKSINKKQVLTFCIRGIIYLGSLAAILAAQVYFTHQFVAYVDGRYLINTMRLSFSIMLVTVFWGLVWLRKSFKNNIEKIFLLLSLSIGITYAIATPMLQETTWDGGIHYGNTIELVYADQDKIPLLDKNVGWLEISYNLNDMNSIKEKYNTNYYYINGTTFTREWSLVGIYNSLGYLPHAAGIFVARGLGLSFTASILTGKIFNVVFFSSIVYLAMKRLKTGKLPMFIIALYPTVLMLSGTYSYDTWVIGWLLFGLAYLFANIQEKDELISTKEIIIIPLSMFIALGPKAIYFPIMLLCYFMPKSKFKNNQDRRVYYLLTTILMVLSVVSFLVPFVFGVASGTEVGDTRGGENINSSLQVRYVLTHPITYLKTLLIYLKNYWSLGNVSNYTTNLAYIGQGKYSMVLIASMVAALVIGDKCEIEKNINYKFKIFTVILCVCISALVASAFYVAFTAVGADIILGCQARYVLPILFPVVYSLRNTYKPIGINKQFVNFGFISVSTLIAIYTLFSNVIMIYSIY